MANQYTKAAEAGEDKPKGANQFTTGKRQKLDQATKDRIRAEKAAARLERVLDDPNATIDQKTAAAKALLPYGKSTYASIEQSINEEPTSEAEILSQLHSLLANPGTRAQIQAMLAGTPQVVASQEAAPQQDHPERDAA